jgi:hypothetical protein
MCDCRYCGAFSVCGNPGCTNDECPECAEINGTPEPEPEPDPEFERWAEAFGPPCRTGAR